MIRPQPLLGAAAGLATACALAAHKPPGGIDMQHVAVDLRLDWAARQAVATATLTLVPLQASASIALDAAQLQVTSVHDGEGRALAFVNDSARVDRHGAAPADGALRIALGRQAPAGQPLTLVVRYRTAWVNHSDPQNLGGSSGRGLRFMQPGSAEPTRRRQVWASGEPGAVRWWLPGHDHPADLRSSELRATVPAPLQVLAGGRLVGVQHHADGMRTYHWRTETPEPHHRTTFVVGEFTPVPQHHPTVRLLNQGYPDEAAGVAASAVMHADALDFLERLLGQPFPQRGHTQVFVQDLPWNTPGSGLSVLSENFVDDLGTHEDFQYLWDGLQTESLAQQWLGGRWPLCDWRQLWLEKALAHHLAALYTEHRHGRDENLMWYVAANQASALGDAANGLREPVLPAAAMTLDELARFAGGNTPTFRGATVLHGLRELLGHERWARSLRRFAAGAAAGGCLHTDALQRAAEAEHGKPLDAFFAQWLRRSAHPVFEVRTRWLGAATGGPGGTLELQVHQRQAAAAGEDRPFYFQGAIDVQVDEQVQRLELQAQELNRFEVSLPAAPRLVHLDPQAAWLKELRHAKSDEALLHQLRAARAAPVRSWAAAELLARVQKVSAPGSTQAAVPQQPLRHAVIAALGETIARPDLYWRVRFQALSQLATLLTPADPRQPAAVDADTTALLRRVIDSEGGWLRAGALRALGLSRDPRHAERYRELLHDASDRVVNAAAIALGRSGSALAFDALAALPARPSWKSQSLISALNGLAELGDPRGREIALAAFANLSAPHWMLATPVWDHRLAAADTLVALGHTAPATAMALERFDRALAEGEVNDTFLTAQVLVTLGDAASQRIFPPLQRQFAHDPQALQAVQALQERLAARRK